MMSKVSCTEALSAPLDVGCYPYQGLCLSLWHYIFLEWQFFIILGGHNDTKQRKIKTDRWMYYFSLITLHPVLSFADLQKKKML